MTDKMPMLKMKMSFKSMTSFSIFKNYKQKTKLNPKKVETINMNMKINNNNKKNRKKKINKFKGCIFDIYKNVKIQQDCITKMRRLNISISIIIKVTDLQMLKL